MHKQSKVWKLVWTAHSQGTESCTDQQTPEAEEETKEDENEETVEDDETDEEEEAEVEEQNTVADIYLEEVDNDTEDFNEEQQTEQRTEATISDEFIATLLEDPLWMTSKERKTPLFQNNSKIFTHIVVDGKAHSMLEKTFYSDAPIQGTKETIYVKPYQKFKEAFAGRHPWKENIVLPSKIHWLGEKVHQM